MAVPNDPPSSPSNGAHVRAAEAEAEKKEAKMHAYPAEPEPLPSKVKRVLRFIGAILDF